MAKFHCLRCGACCRIKGGIVRVSDAEIARLAAALGLGEDAFIASYTDISPDRRCLVLKDREDGACIFLKGDNVCKVNAAKPDQCETFPSAWRNPDSETLCPALNQSAMS